MILNIKYLENYDKNWGHLEFKQGNSAVDLRAAISKPIKIYPGTHVVIPTGISVELISSIRDKENYYSENGDIHTSISKRREVSFEEDTIELQVRPRSGLSARQGLVNVIGTIDSSYRGEIGAIVYNLNSSVIPYVDIDSDEFDADNPIEVLYNKNAEVVINPGDRIAQLIVSNIIKPRVVEVDNLSDTERGSKGFGSSGVK